MINTNYISIDHLIFLYYTCINFSSCSQYK